MATFNSDIAGSSDQSTLLATGTVTVPFSATPSSNTAAEENVITVAKIPAGATITDAYVSLGAGSAGVTGLTGLIKVLQTGASSPSIIISAAVPIAAAGNFGRATLALPVTTSLATSSISDTVTVTVTTSAKVITTGDAVAGAVTYTFQRRDLGTDNAAADF